MTNYVGNGKKRNGQYGEWFTLSINLNDASNFADEKGWVKLKMQQMKEEDKMGNTHSVAINEYKKPE